MYQADTAEEHKAKTRKDRNQRAKSMGMRFAQLADMEDLNSSDMDTDTGEEDQAQVEGNLVNSPKPNEERGSLNNDGTPASNSVETVVLSASHPDLLVGAKQVCAAVHSETENPKGQSILRRMKEKALKDITNKLEAGPVSFKPKWSGPRGGPGVTIREGVMLENKLSDNKAHTSGGEKGIDMRAGPNLARLPDLYLGRGRELALNQTDPKFHNAR